MKHEVFILGGRQLISKARRGGRKSRELRKGRRERIEKGSRERLEKERKEKETKRQFEEEDLRDSPFLEISRYSPVM